jgi:lysozyme family protein
MTTETFGRALSLVLKHEGGFVDHPKDPGGATNLGVTIGTLSAWLGRPATKADVKSLTVPAVSPIYKQNYWDKVRADELPAGVDYCVFDAAVNSGPSRAAKWLQRAVGAEADGAVGSETLKAVRALPAAVIINRICDDRLAFLKNLATWGTFGKGWSSRVEGVRREALAMARAPAPMPAPSPPDIEPAPVPVSQPATSGGLFSALKGFLEALFGKKA